MKLKKEILIALLVLILAALACSFGNGPNNQTNANTPTEPEYTAPEPITEGASNPETISDDEPVVISGEIPFTSPFFINMTAEPFVLLEDQAGFYARDLDFEFPLVGQQIGPVWELDEQTYSTMQQQAFQDWFDEQRAAAETTILVTFGSGE